jgi:hypothetical protein
MIIGPHAFQHPLFLTAELAGTWRCETQNDLDLMTLQWNANTHMFEANVWDIQHTVLRHAKVNQAGWMEIHRTSGECTTRQLGFFGPQDSIKIPPNSQLMANNAR